ncbi:hypothetical protein JCM10213_006874 [Rhodosporidiobolus nylandii]
MPVPALPFPLLRRQSAANLCNASLVPPPEDAVGLPQLGSQQVVAIALARGTQNYTCTLSQQVESGSVAVLVDVTCVAAYLAQKNESSSTSSSASSSSAASSTTSSSALSTTTAGGGGESSITGSVTTNAAPAPSAFLFPLDPSFAQPSSPSSSSNNTDGGGFNLSTLPSLALTVPFPYNASSFPYSSASSFLGEHYWVNSTSSPGQVKPFWSLPGYGSVTAMEVNRTMSPGGNSTDEAWAAYEAENGGQGAFATTVWRVDTAGGGLGGGQNCSSEGNQTAVDFAALFYSFR